MLTILIIYITILFVVGIYDATKVKNFEDYSVAGKKQNFIRVFLSLMATMIGASATIGIADRVVKIGFPAFWWLGVGTIGLLLQALLLSKKIRSLDAGTLPDIACITVGTGGRNLLAIIIAVAWVGIIAAQFVSIAKVLAVMLPDIDRSRILLVISVVVILYTLIGGQMSVMKTDSIQSWIIAGGIVITFVYLFTNDSNSNNIIINNISLINKEFDVLDWINLLFITGGAYFLGPDIISRNLVSKDGKIAKKAAMISALCLAIFGILITLIAMWAVENITPDVMNGQNPLIYIMQKYVPYPIAILLCLALTSALISSADTCMINAATIVEHDLLKRHKVSEVRIIVCILGLAGLLIALYRSDIIGLLMGAYSIYVPGIVCPLFIAIWFYGSREIYKPLWYGAVISGGSFGIVYSVFGVGSDVLPLVGMGISCLLSLLSVKIGSKKSRYTDISEN